MRLKEIMHVNRLLGCLLQCTHRCLLWLSPMTQGWREESPCGFVKVDKLYWYLSEVSVSVCLFLHCWSILYMHTCFPRNTWLCQETFLVLTYGNGVRMLLLEWAARDRSVYYVRSTMHKTHLLPPVLHLSLRSFPIPNAGRAGVRKPLSKWKGILCRGVMNKCPPRNQFLKYLLLLCPRYEWHHHLPGVSYSQFLLHSCLHRFISFWQEPGKAG